MAFLSSFRGWLSRLGGATGEAPGMQVTAPGASVIDDAMAIGVDGALQISTVWLCVDRRASVIASLPLFVYERKANGQKDLARTSRLYQLLHDSPNARMTPMEFWRAMISQHDLRGAGYARIDRDANGEAMSLWPMPTDQVTPHVLDDGAMVYEYRIGADVVVLAEQNVLVIKGLGNGTTGLDKLAYMRGTTTEAVRAQSAATRLFSSGGKPTGALIVDAVLKPEQRATLRERFKEMAEGNMSRLYLLEAGMKYQQLSLSPEDQQILQTRQFSVEEICRWFDVPPVLAHHSNVTTWGSGVQEIVSGWQKLVLRPLLVNIEQAIAKRVLTPAQRARYAVEFNFDALLRADPETRAAFYASGVQNGWMRRAEVRQLENLPPVDGPGAALLTAQANLVPIDLMGTVKPSGASTDAAAQAPVAQ